MSAYQDFLASKQIRIQPSGFSAENLNSKLYAFQRDIDSWSVERGRSALFADCGLGKTPMQLVWAEQVMRKLNKPVLVLAPLAVSKQTEREGKKFGIETKIVTSDLDISGPGIYITNYQKLNHFSATTFDGGVVLDESSILKGLNSATKTLLIDRFIDTPMKLCCTATPSPNDFMELGNHAEFLGVLTHTEMLSTFFVHDGGETAKWRLKGHAEDEYWKWICQWAVMLRKPSDLGYSDEGFDLPALTYHNHVVAAKPQDGLLFAELASTMDERRKARRSSLTERAELCAELVNNSTEPWLVWVDLNDEGNQLAKLISDSIQVSGSDSDEDKEERMLGFSDDQYRVLISKPSICGHGMNWQHCPNIAFVGLSDSFERFYQAIRRCWRFGQKNPVNVHIITSEAEGAVLRNIQRKEADAERMATEMLKHMSVYNTENIHMRTLRTATSYNPTKRMTLPKFLMENL